LSSERSLADKGIEKNGVRYGGKGISLFVDVNETERDLDQMMKNMRQKARTK